MTAAAPVGGATTPPSTDPFPLLIGAIPPLPVSTVLTGETRTSLIFPSPNTVTSLTGTISDPGRTFIDGRT